MAKVPNSECSINVSESFLRSFSEDEIKAAQGLLTDQFRYQGSSLMQKDTTAVVIANAFMNTAMRAVKEPLEKGLTDSWVTRTEMTAVAKPGTKGGPREAMNTSLMHQHRLLLGQTSILGQTRSFYGLGNGMFNPGAAVNYVTRLNYFDGLFRVSGIPLVTLKAGGDHVSHLTVGDIFKVFTGAGETDTLIKGFLRTNDPTQNIPFQNVAEAVRRIIQHNDDRLLLQGEDLAKLDADVLDALLNAAGRPVDEVGAKGLDDTRAWMMGDEGRVVLGEVKTVLMRNAEKFIAEDLRQRQIALVFQQADGIRMTQQTLDTLVATPWTLGDRVEALGALMFDDLLKKLYGDDFMVKLSPDGVNLAFGHQFLAKAFAQLAPENQAMIREVWSNIKAAKADSAKATKTGKKSNTAKNKARKQTSDETAENAQKLAEDQVKNDPNVAVDAATREEGVIAKTFYNELQYGGAVAGLSKVLSKVSDRSTMTTKGKSLLINTEHVRLETAATIAAGLRKLNDSLGSTPAVQAARANRIFETIKKNLGRDEKTIEDVLGFLDEADRPAGKTMIEYIDAMFGVGDNNALMRNGIFVEELAMSLKKVNLPKQADVITGSGALSTDQLADYWRNIAPEEGENILDVMSKFYSAQQISMIPPTMADSLVRHFSHTAEGLSFEQANKQGWFALDEGSTLGKYMSYNQKEKILFPPEMQSRIKAIEGYLDYDRAINTLPNLMRKVDEITSILKSSITLWRPGHHMVSFLGNTFMNVLAGVAPYDYAIGVKLLTKRGDLFDVDDAALNEFMRLNAPAGTQLKTEALENIKVPIIKNGKTTFVTLDVGTINLAMERFGAYINPRRVRDIVTTDDLGSGAFSASRLLTKNPITRGIEGADHQIAKFAAIRDNVARSALFVKELRKMSPKASLEDAFLEAASIVHEFHPTVGTLTAPERKIARRVFYFYTWQKQAFFKIMELTANSPAVMTVPSKFQFAIATAQGLDPLSFGDPYSANGLFAAYNSASLYGPQWDDPVYGAMGVKPPIAQLDVIDSYLSGIRIKPEDGLWQNVGNLAATTAQEILVGQASPLFRVPAELAIGRRVGTGQAITNVGEYAIDQTGLGSLSRIYDWTPWGPRSDTDLDPYADFNRQRQWWNYLGGLKVTNYESPASLNVARQEALDYWRKTNQVGKYAPKVSLQEYREMTNNE